MTALSIQVSPERLDSGARAMKAPRVGFYGFGAMARAIARECISRRAQVTAVVDPEFAGASLVDLVDLGDPDGEAGPLTEIVVGADSRGLEQAPPDVVIHSTPRESDLAGQLDEIVATGSNVISISGITHIWQEQPAWAESIDAAAKSAGATVVGTGINPGFLLEALPVFLSSVCADLTAISAWRLANLDEFGASVMETCGINLTEDDFEQKVANGDLPLHTEGRQSIDFIADALQWPIRDTTESRVPILTSKERHGRAVTVRAGHVCGYRHRFIANAERDREIRLEVCGLLSPTAQDGVPLQTQITLSGRPTMHLTLGGDIVDHPADGVVGRVCNLVPWVLRARAGLVSVGEVPVTGAALSRTWDELAQPARTTRDRDDA